MHNTFALAYRKRAGHDCNRQRPSRDEGRSSKTPGAYAYLPSKHAHAFSCPMACSYFIMADDKFDIHYVDEGGNEIPPDQALAKAGHAKKPKPMPKAAPTPKS